MSIRVWGPSGQPGCVFTPQSTHSHDSTMLSCTALSLCQDSNCSFLRVAVMMLSPSMLGCHPLSDEIGTPLDLGPQQPDDLSIIRSVFHHVSSAQHAKLEVGRMLNRVLTFLQRHRSFSFFP